MDYKELYKEWAQTLTELGCYVYDQDFLGYCCHTESIKAFIIIKPHLSYKYKFYCLAHEVGHLFYMKKGKILNWSAKPRSEEQANWFAVQLLKINEADVEEYKDFYNRALKTVKNRRKSWHEL